MEDVIVNRVAQSGLITIDLADFYPDEPIVVTDLKDWLFHGLILKEKDFREKLETHDWQQYEGKIVAITLSTDAIVPMWAYMLLTVKLSNIATFVAVGSAEHVFEQAFLHRLNAVDAEEYQDKRVVIKGCGDKEVPAAAYVALSHRLTPVVKALMFGEPCSTVPVYKQPRK